MIIETETGVFMYSRHLSDEQIRCCLSRDRWHVHNRTENPADVEAMLLRLNTAGIRPKDVLTFQVPHKGHLRIQCR